MLALKLSLFLLISNGVLSREIRRGSTRYRHSEDEYKYNHPPAPEGYEAIPVAVVYEDESSRDDKSIKSSVAPGNNIEQVNEEPAKLETSATKEPNDIEVVKNKQVDGKTSNVGQDELKITTYRPQREQQIPVAVVYDPEPTYTQKPRPNSSRLPNKRRKNPRPAPKEKLTEVQETPNSNVQVNGHIGSIITENYPKDFIKNQKLRPLEEKPTLLGNSDHSEIPNMESPSTTSTSSSTEKPNKFNNRQDIQQTEEKQVLQEDGHPSEEKENKYILLHANIPQVEKVDDLSKKRKTRPVTVEKTEVLEDDTNVSSQVYENTPSTLKKHLDSNQQFSRTGNASRVREIVPIIQSENHVYGQSGNFRYSYEGGDGTKAFEEGELKTFDDENAGEAVSGGFSYTAKDGKEYSLSYTADENGYRPVGAHLPTPPPIPPAIARALAHLATKTTPEPVTESLAEYDE